MASGRFAFVTMVVGAAWLTACSRDETYPSRPITIVCPWAAGGGTDLASRQMAIFLKQELQAPAVNVINAIGGAGVTGHNRGASARPDGYTLTMMTVEINMLRWRKLTEISWEDFAPLMLINREPAALFVRTDSPWTSLDELTTDVRERPGQLQASGTSIGGIWHLALAGWLTAVGQSPTDIKWIPMNGAGPSIQELLSGGLDLVCCSVPEARSPLESGQVRCLGVMARARSQLFPNYPTFLEQGADWTMAGWRGLGVPRDTPETIQQRLVEALTRIVEGQTRVQGDKGEVSWPELLAAQKTDGSWQGPEAFRETLRRTDSELGKLLTSDEFAALTKGRFRPYDFPRLLFLCAGILLLPLLAGRLRGRPTVPKAPRATRGRVIHFFETILSVVFFLLFAEALGFVLTSGILVFFLTWRLGTRPLVAALVAAGFVPFVYHLFANLLDVPLPRGLLDW